MIDRAHPLPVARQARLLGLSRSSVYYEPVPTSAADLALMAAMDDLHMKLPFYGIRRIRGELKGPGPCGRKTACGHPEAHDGDRGAYIPSAGSRSPSPATRSTPTFCATWTSP